MAFIDAIVALIFWRIHDAKAFAFVAGACVDADCSGGFEATGTLIGVASGGLVAHCSGGFKATGTPIGVGSGGLVAACAAGFGAAPF